MKKRRKKQKKSLKRLALALIAILILFAIGYSNPEIQNQMQNYLEVGVSELTQGIENITSELSNTTQSSTQTISFDLSSIPEYEDSPYVYINGNIPDFTEEDYTTESFETYSELDSLGRCGVAYANICLEIMPQDGEERGSISSIYPSGWNNVKYEGIVDGGYLYNRSHLIGWQLSAENANKLNLITGTRYMNVEGMLPFENLVADYIDENPDNHVLYRVTPIFEGDNLVASGVQMEAYSVEDNGEGVCFNVYVYNVQPGIMIDYATGESSV